MNRNFYLDLAAQGLRMPIGADLLLHEEPDPDEVLLHPERLGTVVEKAARRYRTPLAFPLMDLRLEKADLLSLLGVPESDADKFHFSETPSADQVSRVTSAESEPFSERIQANQGAVRYIREKTDLFPVGMLIGPFSLMTKLVVDPITAVAMAAGGVTGEEDDDVLDGGALPDHGAGGRAEVGEGADRGGGARHYRLRARGEHRLSLAAPDAGRFGRP